MAVLLTQCTDFTAEPKPVFTAKHKNTENKHVVGFAKVKEKKRKRKLWHVRLYFKEYLHD